ncbi:TolC family protein [uncultured Chitinophaga sp.]|uniref:TolC family protein n=1 Tax=uncultured Chitinophaga sp. TaxID=339340 RepID=UPI0025D008FB|nr:TolC family protein [uncultured Chitinophaga sp.]
MQLQRKLIGLLGAMMPLVATVHAQQQAPATQGVQPLSVQQAIDYALANQNSIKTAKLDELIALARNKEVSGLALPNISATGNFQDNPVIQKQLLDASNFDPTVPKGTLVPFAFGLKYNAGGQVNINQVLFDPSVLVALQARRTLEELANKNVKKAEIDVKAQVYQSYYSVLSAQKALDFLSGNIGRLEQMLNETNEIYKNGLAEKLDVDRLTVQVTNLRTEQTRLRNMIEVTTASLKYQIGMPLNQPVQFTDTLDVNVARTMEDVSGFNYTERIEYQLLDAQKRANEYNLKRYRLAHLPTLSAFANGGASRQTNKFDYLGSEMWYGYVSWGLNLNVPIFNGNQRKRQTEQAYLEVEKSSVAINNVKLGIDLERQTSATTFRNNVLSLEAQEKNMGLAQEVLSVTRTKYREGVGSSLEMITAENDLLTAQNNYFNALYNAISAKIDYLKANGKL